jgi:uncharacterized LabA/DUF88 family protein
MRAERIPVSNDRLKIAVFIDFDNIEIGVKSTLGGHFDVGAVLEAVKERGEVVSKIAYGDWTRATDYSRSMSQHAIHMVQRSLTPGGDKNGADINLALDALEMAFTHNHINAFVIVGGDSDFITLVEKLKQYDRKVFVVGGRSFTSQVMQKNCTEFIAYEDMLGVSGRGRHTGGRPRVLADVGAAMPLIRRAIKLLADREMMPQLGLLKSTLLQLDSSFSEKAYGAGSFRDFVEKLAKAGYVVVKGADRSFHVELRDTGNGATAPAAPAQRETHAPTGERHRGHGRPSHDATDSQAETAAAPASVADADHTPSSEVAPRPGPADGYRVMVQAFSQGGATPRFPMYVRQVRQFLKTVDESFDERRYGFAGMVDALRFAQREGLFRLDRDRRGGVRVHPGPQFPAPTTPAEAAPEAAIAAAGGLPEAPPLPAEAAIAPMLPFAVEEPPAAPEHSISGADTTPMAQDSGEAPSAPAGEAVAADEPEPAAEPALAPRRTPRKRTTTGTTARAKKAAAPAGAAKKKAAKPRAKKASQG